jgi:hypothetical protein
MSKSRLSNHIDHQHSDHHHGQGAHDKPHPRVLSTSPYHSLPPFLPPSSHARLPRPRPVGGKPKWTLAQGVGPKTLELDHSRSNRIYKPSLRGVIGNPQICVRALGRGRGLLQGCARAERRGGGREKECRVCYVCVSVPFIGPFSSLTPHPSLTAGEEEVETGGRLRKKRPSFLEPFRAEPEEQAEGFLAKLNLIGSAAGAVEGEAARNFHKGVGY